MTSPWNDPYEVEIPALGSDMDEKDHDTVGREDENDRQFNRDSYRL